MRMKKIGVATASKISTNEPNFIKPSTGVPPPCKRKI
jgi:hypothetical protein